MRFIIQSVNGKKKPVEVRPGQTVTKGKLFLQGLTTGYAQSLVAFATEPGYCVTGRARNGQRTPRLMRQTATVLTPDDTPARLYVSGFGQRKVFWVRSVRHDPIRRAAVAVRNISNGGDRRPKPRR